MVDMISNQCSHDGCAASGKLTRGLCRKHYMRLYRTGSSSTVRKPGDPGDGRRKHMLYGAWAGMKNRCHNPNNSAFPRYGAKGIYVCDRWRKDFRAFLSDMGERPEGMTLDRIDPYGPYTPENCRWATASEQRKNRTLEGDLANRKAMSDGVKRSWAARRNRPSR